MKVQPDADAVVTAKMTGVRAYDWASIARVAYTAAAADSDALPAGEYAISVSTRAYILVSQAGTNPTATTGFPLAADLPFHIRVDEDDIISVIRDSADGHLHIMPVAG